MPVGALAKAPDRRKVKHMAKKSASGVFVGTPRNQVANTDPNSPDISGGGLYGSYEEVIGMQLSQDGSDLATTPNSRSGSGIMGQPAAGEPAPAGMHSPTGEDQE